MIVFVGLLVVFQLSLLIFEVSRVGAELRIINDRKKRELDQ